MVSIGVGIAFAASVLLAVFGWLFAIVMLNQYNLLDTKEHGERTRADFFKRLAEDREHEIQKWWRKCNRLRAELGRRN
jgi:tRNA splicing ligase